MALLDSADAQQITSANLIKPWHQISAPELRIESTTRIHTHSPFTFNEEINKRVALWAGDITELCVHAIVNSTNERLNERSIHSERVLTKAGPQLVEYIDKHIRICKTGDAKLSKGYDLPSRYIIHTVGPKYNSKYHTASESALYSCYANVLQLVVEHELKTVALCAINTQIRGYPRQSGAHIALRVVRRFMEKQWHQIDLIVFAVDGVDIGVYEQLMPLYFPRTLEEEQYALYYLPQDIGGANGQPVIPEREIRIAAKPNTTRIEESVDLSSGMESSVAVGKTAFAKMHGDFDKRWRASHTSMKRNDPLTVETQRQLHYERLLRKSKTEDFSDYANSRCLYVTGEDRHGRVIVVMVGKRFNAETMTNERSIMYLISLLDSVVTKDYVVIYFHTLTEAENHPSIGFVQNVYNTLGHNYKKNLKAFYIVHPSFWCRVLVWWFTTFNASVIKRKVYCLGGVEYLHNIMPLQQLQVPSFVMDYDQKVNGVRYNSDAYDAHTTADNL